MRPSQKAKTRHPEFLSGSQQLENQYLLEAETIPIAIGTA